MRLSPRDVATDLFSLLLFLRLGFVTFLCYLGLPLVSKQYGFAIGTMACVIAFPLWWYHFGLPRLKEQPRGFNFFSAEFCLWGYVVMTAWLIVDIWECFREVHP